MSQNFTEEQHEQVDKVAASRHANVDLNGENANIDLNGEKPWHAHCRVLVKVGRADQQYMKESSKTAAISVGLVSEPFDYLTFRAHQSDNN